MFILEKYKSWDEIDVGETYYSDVTFKDGFLTTLQKALEEQNKIVVFYGREMNPNEVIELLKATQSKQISPEARCHVFDRVSNHGYFEIIIIKDDDSEEETFKVHLNLTDITKPILYVATKPMLYVA